MAAISLRTILMLYLPLAFSSLMIGLSNPVMNAGLARLPDPELSLAAFGFAWSVDMLLESPIMMILSTAVALIKDRRSYEVTLRFTLGIGLALMFIALAIAASPLYYVLALDVMSIPSTIAEAGRPALLAVSFFSIPIGLRRMHQGILIRYRLNRLIALGTALRFVVLFPLFYLTAVIVGIPGPGAAGLSYLIGLVVEAIATLLWTLPVVRRELTPREPEGEPLSYRRLVAFHWPLAATTIMRNLVQPIVAAGLARMAYPELTLAAWPVAFATVALLNLLSSSIQELTIALVRDSASLRSIWRFVHGLSLALVVFLALVAFTPLADIFVTYVMGVGPSIHDFTVAGIRWLVLVPALMAYQSLLRGLMSVRWQTGAVRTGMIINLGTLAGVLALGVWYGDAPAMMVAGVAALLATAAEVGYLARVARSAPQAATAPTLAGL